MNMRFLFVLLIISHSTARLFAGGAVSVDTQPLKEAVVIPTAESLSITNLEGRIKSREELYLLAVKAAESPGLSNVVRFSTCASACEQYQDFLSLLLFSADIHGPSADVYSFTNPTIASNVVHLVDISLKLLRETTAPIAWMNIGPPHSDKLFISASGMDPKSIADPEIRAEYERLIAANGSRIEEGNCRAKLGQEIEHLENSIVKLVHILDSEGRATSMKSAISGSELPAEIKERLLVKWSVSEK
jgi:hypothetical protein